MHIHSQQHPIICAHNACCVRMESYLYLYKLSGTPINKEHQGYDTRVYFYRRPGLLWMRMTHVAAYADADSGRRSSDSQPIYNRCGRFKFV